MSNELFKPNEFIAIIERTNVNRVARHLWNFFLMYAQREIRFAKHEGCDFEVKVTEINGLANYHQRNYLQLKNSLECLMTRVTLRDDPKGYEAIVPMTKLKIDVENGLYKFTLQPEVVELLSRTDYFTKLDVTEFNSFKSKYSFIIYEWLKRYETKKGSTHTIPVMTLDELRKITGTSESKGYKLFANIKLKILDVAVQEINEFTRYTLSYKPVSGVVKTRSRTVGIQFNFSKKIDAVEVDCENKVAKENELERENYIAKEYSDLCEKYLEKKLCDKAEDFYLTTYMADIDCLKYFLDRKSKYNRTKKKTPIFWLQEDLVRNKKPGRRKEQKDYFDGLLLRVLQTPNGEQKAKEFIKCREMEGFLSQLIRIQKYLKIENNKEDRNTISPIDDWL